MPIREEDLELINRSIHSNIDTAKEEINEKLVTLEDTMRSLNEQNAQYLHNLHSEFDDYMKHRKRERADGA